MLTRLSGSGFVLNCDLIERVDPTPDTVVSLCDGKKYVVLETPEQVIQAVRRYRGEVLAVAHVLERTAHELLDVPEQTYPVAAPAPVTLLRRED